jgi:hypothetical protein
MNLQRGAKRITLVVSVVAGLVAWVYSSIALFDHWYWEREQYLAYKEKYENLKWFWETWDADAWTRGGNSMTKNDVLRALLGLPLYGMRFTRQIDPELDFRIQFRLSGCDVLPGMNLAMLDLPAAALAEAVRKARVRGSNNARFDYVCAGTFWAKRTRPQLLLISVMSGSAIGSAASITIWVLFFLLRWIGCGFVTGPKQIPEAGQSDDPVLLWQKGSSGGDVGESSACNPQEDVTEVGKQPTSVR